MFKILKWMGILVFLIVFLAIVYSFEEIVFSYKFYWKLKKIKNKIFRRRLNPSSFIFEFY